MKKRLLLSKLRIIFWAIGLLVCAPVAVQAQDSGEIVVEEESGASGSSSESEKGSSTIEQVGKVILYLGLLGAMGLAAMQFVKQGSKRFMPGAGKKGGGLKVTDTHMLGNKQFLVVVEYEGKKILLGVGPGMINNLCYLNSNVTENTQRIDEPPKEITR